LKPIDNIIGRMVANYTGNISPWLFNKDNPQGPLEICLCNDNPRPDAAATPLDAMCGAEAYSVLPALQPGGYACLDRRSRAPDAM